MEIKPEHYSPKVIRLFINLSITIPFIITVICCILVVLKLRHNAQCDIQDSVSDAPSNGHVTSGADHLQGRRSRAFTRSSSTSMSKLSTNYGFSRESSQHGNGEHQPCESPIKAVNLVLMRENSREWLRETSREFIRGTLSRFSLSRPTERQFSRSQSQLQDTGSSRRASITITIITAAFIISYGPYMILWIYSLLVHELRLFDPVVTITSTHWSIYLYIYLIGTTLLSTFNSCIFPLIYFIRIKGRLYERLRGSLKDRWILMQEDPNKFNYEQVENKQENTIL